MLRRYIEADVNNGLLTSEGNTWVGPNTLRAIGLWRVVFGHISNKSSRSLKHCFNIHCAGVAQLAEQLICNQQVAGSSPVAGSSWLSVPSKTTPGGQQDRLFF